MTNAHFQKVGIELGNILEPIVPLCRTKESKAWNGMIKAHFKDLEIDGNMLLTGVRVFTFILDGKQIAAKICKNYANTTYNE